MNSSAAPAPTALEMDPEAIDQPIARVLGGAHRKMEAIDAPNDARTILHVAEAFADELAAVDPQFDRLQFINQVTEDPS